MMSEDAIFDRQDLVKAIHSECLSASGNSSVIVAAHKVGKTHILNHLNSAFGGRRETLFCKVDLDMLQVFAENQPLSDDIFLRFFLRTLLKQMSAWIQRQSKEKELWREQIRQAEEELSTQATPDDRLAQEAVKNKKDMVSALKQQMHELGGLINISVTIQVLIDQAEPLRIPKVTFIIDDLHEIGKRIILFIDEFNRMIKEQGLSDDLFRFLRSANSDGKIIVLASSTVHPMDTSLHPEVDKSDRRSLFNHFNIKVLNPFTKQEAEDFLCWSSNAPLALEQEEKRYLQALGGGSPFFLKVARDLYLERGRPRLDDARREFEQNVLAPALIGPFSQIWQRCTSDDCATLRRIAAGEAVEPGTCFNLKREGYLIESSGSFNIFSTLFADFIKQQPRPFTPSHIPLILEEVAKLKEMQGAPIQAFVEIACEVLPTALYITDFKYADLVKFRIINNTTAPYSVYLSCQIEDYSQTTEVRVTVLPETVHHTTLPVTFRSAKISELKTQVSTQIKCRAEVDMGSYRQVILSEPKKVLLLSLNRLHLVDNGVGQQE